MLLQRKKSAIALRRQGMSYRDISSRLRVARSTLNSWLKDIELTPDQQLKLHNQWLDGTARGRKLGGKANHEAKIRRLALIDEEVKEMCKVNTLDQRHLEMLFVGLYLGDGIKVEGRVGLGNANPGIVVLFLHLLRSLFTIDNNKLRAQIFARADQSESQLIDYWSTLLKIPASHFHMTQYDSRTANRKSWGNYYGVCTVIYADTLLQRRILALGQEMIKYGSSLK